jgi:hypothetical protein
LGSFIVDPYRWLRLYCEKFNKVIVYSIFVIILAVVLILLHYQEKSKSGGSETSAIANIENVFVEVSQAWASS